MRFELTMSINKSKYENRSSLSSTNEVGNNKKICNIISQKLASLRN